MRGVYYVKIKIKARHLLMKTNEKLRKLIFTSLFAALCTVATMIAFPTGTGYVNAGDIIILLGAFTLSPLQAISAAAIGSALADLINGYALYAPGTFVIKAIMVLCALYLSRGLKKINVPSALTIMLSAICGELCMIIGYLIYESSILGYGYAALSGIPANVVQGAFGCVGGIALYYILKNTKLTNKLPAF